MRLTTVPTSALEAAGLALGLGPTPLADTMLALLLARTIMAATSAGIFEVLADGPLTAQQVAARCNTEPRATEKLLYALAGAGYVRASARSYRLAPVARRWLLADSKTSLRDATLHRYLDLQFMGHFEEYLRTGIPLDYHRTLSSEQWAVYQRGQLSHARLAAAEVALRAPLPRRARLMLDLGGAHGYYSVALCRRHKTLRAVVLDLPDAVEHAAPLLAQEGMGGRVVHRAANLLEEDLGSAVYDVVLIANLAHHFDEATNRDLIRRVARALRPGGSCLIVDLLRACAPEDADQINGLTDFFFAVTSRAGTWSPREMANWQRAAGLLPRKAIKIQTSPGLGLQAARKPGA